MKTKLTPVVFMGHVSVDRRCSDNMVPWLLREIREMDKEVKIIIGVEEGYVKGLGEEFEPVVVSDIGKIVRLAMTPDSPFEFFYMVLHDSEDKFSLYLFSYGKNVDVSSL